MRIINIAKEYTRSPGGRLKTEGPYSGEQFREEFLEPAYKHAEETGEKFVVELDGGYGYGSSFLEEAFGGLARRFKGVDKTLIEIVSNEEPQLILDIENYMKN